MIRILFVDDSYEDRLIVKTRLERLAPDLEFVEVESAREALARIEVAPFDCVLSDYQMPGMTGLELLRQIRANGLKVPFIFLTGQGNESTAVDALRSGADDYFTKLEGFAHYDHLLHSIRKLVHMAGEISRKSEAENALRDSEERFISAFEHAPIGKALISTEGRWLKVNRAACELLGYTEAELLEKSFQDITHPDDVATDVARFRQMLSGDIQTYQREKRYIHKLGHPIWVLLSASLFRNQHGKPLYFISQIVDISERKRVENLLERRTQELRENEARLRLALEVAKMGYWRYECASGRVEWSSGHEALFGIPMSAFGDTMDSIAEWVHPDDRDRGAECLRKTLEEDVPYDNTYRVIQPGGEIRWLKAYGYLSRDAQGDPEYIFGTTQDITELKREQESLHLHSLVLDQITDHVTITDLDGVITYVNEAESRSQGRERQELVGQAVDIFGEDAERGATQREIMEHTRQDGAWRCEIVNYAADGREVIMDCRTSLVLDSKGNPIALSGISTDITARKQIEEALRESVESYRALVSGLPDIIMRFDRDGRHLFVSENVSEVVNIHAGQFIGKTHRDLGFPEALCEQMEENIRRVYDDGVPTETEFVFEGRKGETVINLRLVPEHDAGGNVCSVLAISRDVTAQRHIERDYRALFHEMPDGIALHEIVRDADGRPSDFRILSVNAAFEKMLHRGAETLIGRVLQEVLPPTDLDWLERFKQAAQQDESSTFELVLPSKGKYFEVKTFRPTADQFVSVLTDITERKQAEKALAHSHELMSYIIEHNRSAVAVHDRDLNYIYVSKRYLEDYKVKETDVIGRHHYEVFPDLPEKWRIVHQKALKGEISSAESDPYEREDGSVDWTRWECRPWFEADGSIGGIIIYTEVITDRKRAEEALRESEEKYRLLFESAGDAIYIHDDQGRLLAVNSSACSVLGYTHDELMKLTVKEVDTPAEAVHAPARIAQLMAEKEFSFNSMHQRKDGSAFPVEVNARLITLGGKQAMMSICRDITERMRTEELILQQHEQLLLANEELDSFAHAASHDLQAPLRRIAGLIELIETSESEGTASENSRYLDLIRQNALELRGLVDGLLEFSRAKRSEMDRREIDLAEIASGIFAELQRDDPDRPVDVKLQKPLLAYADRKLLSVVLQNLLSNAWKFTNQTDRAVIEFGLKQADGEKVYFVRDNGAGFDPAQAHKLFQPFTRLHPASEFKGHGVGLSTAARIIARHGGRIWADSVPGEGAVFSFTLPIVQ